MLVRHILCVFQSDYEDEGIGETLSDTAWEPDEGATNDPANYRINTWENTFLGRATNNRNDSNSSLQSRSFLHII